MVGSLGGFGLGAGEQERVCCSRVRGKVSACAVIWKMSFLGKGGKHRSDGRYKLVVSIADGRERGAFAIF